MRRFIEQELTPTRFYVSPPNKLRKRQFYTKGVDRLFKANEDTVEYAFDKFATNNGKIKFIPYAKVMNDILGNIFKIGNAKA